MSGPCTSTTGATRRGGPCPPTACCRRRWPSATWSTETGDGPRWSSATGTATSMHSRGNGQRVWKTQPGPRGAKGDGYEGGPTIGDLDGDGDQDIAIGYGLGGALMVDGASGRLLAVVGGTLYASVGAPAIGGLRSLGRAPARHPGMGTSGRGIRLRPDHLHRPAPHDGALGLAGLPQERTEAGRSAHRGRFRAARLLRTQQQPHGHPGCSCRSRVLGAGSWGRPLHLRHCRLPGCTRRHEAADPQLRHDRPATGRRLLGGRSRRGGAGLRCCPVVRGLSFVRVDGGRRLHPLHPLGAGLPPLHVGRGCLLLRGTPGSSARSARSASGPRPRSWMRG